MLSVFIESVELASLEPRFIPEDFSYSPEAVVDDEDLSDQTTTGCETVTASPSRRIFTDAEIAADVIASQDQGQGGESATTVEKKWERAAETLTPSIAFDRAHFLLEPRSKNSFLVARYVADVFLACKHALRNDLKLWVMYRRLFEEGQHGTIPAHVLARSKDVQNIKFLCGTEILKRRVHSFTLYAASVRHKKPATAGGLRVRL